MTPNEHDTAKLQIERDRLTLEKQQSLFRFIAVIGACVTFAFSAFQYFDGRAREIDSRKVAEQSAAEQRQIISKRDSELRRIEASKVFLERQLELFEEAVSLTARLAVAHPRDRKPEDVQRFWELYWGELGMVERGDVASAMVHFGRLLNADAARANAAPPGAVASGVAESDPGIRDQMGPAAIAVAHAARAELARSWDIDEWKR